MVLKSEASLTVGLASGALVVAVFNGAVPKVADGRSAKPANADYSASIKLAGWTSLALVSGISLLAKDPTVFVIGGSTMVILTLWHKHANLVDPAIARASAALNIAPDVTQEADENAYGYADAFV